MTRSTTAPRGTWRHTLAKNRPSRLTFALLGLVAGFLAGVLLLGLAYEFLDLFGEALVEGADYHGLAVIGAFLTPLLCAVICAVWGFFGGEHMLERLEDLWGSPTHTHPHDP